MSNGYEDPHLLPEDALDKTPSTSNRAASSNQQHYRPKAVPGRAPFYVLSNVLSAREKAKYKSISEWEDDEDEDAEEIIEIEGEHTIDGKTYCFARHRDGLLRRVRLLQFSAIANALLISLVERNANIQVSIS